MRKMGGAIIVAALCIFESASVARGIDLRMMLTIDDRDVGKMASGKDIRRALAKCKPPKTCAYIYLHREPQIDYAANYEDGGYTISHRTGPPGPDFDAQRRGKGSRDHFSVKEMITITADYIEGKQTPFVHWKSSPLP